VKRFSKSLTAGVAAGALAISGLAMVLTASPSGAAVTTAQIGGIDRYDTARLAAQVLFAGGSSTVVLASGENFPDGLASADLAGAIGVPLLLTPAASLAPETVSALATLKAHTIDVVGGSAAVSAAVITQLQGLGYTVTVISGADRYATAAAVATAAATSAPVGTVSGLKTAIVATGANFPDALSGGPASYFAHLPVLLTDPNTLSTATSTAITALGIQHVIIMGGTSAVSTAVETAIKALIVGGVAVTTQREAGDTRFQTATDMATFDTTPTFSGGLAMSLANLTFASGLNFPDALVSAEFKNPIILDGSGLPAETASFLTANAASITGTITAIGGTAVIPAADLAAAANAVSPTATAATLSGVAFGVSFTATFAAPVNNVGVANFLLNNAALPAGSLVTQVGPASYRVNLNALPPAAQPNVLHPGDIISINTANAPTAVSNGAAVPASSFTVPANAAPAIGNVNFFVTNAGGVPALSVQFSKPVQIPAAAAPAPAGVVCICGGVSTNLTVANAATISQDDTTFTWTAASAGILAIVGTDSLTVNTTVNDLSGPAPAAGLALGARSVYAPVLNTVAPAISLVVNTPVNTAPTSTVEGALDVHAAFGQVAGAFALTAKVGGAADGALGSAFVIKTAVAAAGQTAVAVTTASGPLAGQTTITISTPGGASAYTSGIALAAALNANPTFSSVLVANSTGVVAVPATGAAVLGPLAGGVSYYAESAVLSKTIVNTAGLTTAANWAVSSGAQVIAVTLDNNATPAIVTVTVEAGPGIVPPGTATATSYQNVVVNGVTTLTWTSPGTVRDFAGNLFGTQTATV
jgi:putative cell wall-binding protein